LYEKNTKREESISLSKRDKLFEDAIVTAACSSSTEVAEELLTYFVDIGNKECFAALLYACFDLLSPDDGVDNTLNRLSLSDDDDYRIVY